MIKKKMTNGIKPAVSGIKPGTLLKITKEIAGICYISIPNVPEEQKMFVNIIKPGENVFVIRCLSRTESFKKYNRNERLFIALYDEKKVAISPAFFHEDFVEIISK